MEQGSILIIDDDPDITEAMTVILENRGYEVRQRRRQLQGHGAVEGSPARPDHPRRDDEDVPGGLRAFPGAQAEQRKYKDIPILMLTAVKQKTGLDFKPDAGDQSWLPVEEFLDKPVKPDVLMDKVEDLLSRRVDTV